MYLETASTVEDVLTYGVKPCIEFLSMAEDYRQAGDDDLAEMLLIEVKGKLFQIRDALAGGRIKI